MQAACLGVQQELDMRTFFSLHRCGRSRRRRYSDFRRRFARSLRQARWANSCEKAARSPLSEPSPPPSPPSPPSPRSFERLVQPRFRARAFAGGARCCAPVSSSLGISSNRPNDHFIFIEGLGTDDRRVRRVLIAAAGVATLVVALSAHRSWFQAWNAGAVVFAIAAAATVLVLAIGVAVRGSPHAVARVASGGLVFRLRIVAAETMLLLRAPEKWSDDPLAQQLLVHERAARRQGIAYDGRCRPRSSGTCGRKDWMPCPVSRRATLPTWRSRTRFTSAACCLSNVANALVVECNEGTGYFQFRSDQFGFNNPPGLSAGPIDVAVIGESRRSGTASPPRRAPSIVYGKRFRGPPTLAWPDRGSYPELGVFREYVEPLRPSVVVWFISVNYAEPRQESEQPMLMRYLREATFSQGLRQRQRDVDHSFGMYWCRCISGGDRDLRDEIGDASAFPFEQVLKLNEVRRSSISTSLPNACPRRRACPSSSLRWTAWRKRQAVGWQSDRRHLAELRDIRGAPTERRTFHEAVRPRSATRQ